MNYRKTKRNICIKILIIILFTVTMPAFGATTCPDPLNPGQTVPPILTTITGGNPDGFILTDGEEPTVRSTGLQAIINNYATVNGNFIPGRANRPFDVMSDNQFFGHTLTGLPTNIIDANLEIRLKGSQTIVGNDEIGILDNMGEIAWIRSIRDLPGATGTWVQNQDVVFNLNLQQLPGNIDLLPHLNTDQTLDVLVQDDTAVDYMILNVTSCPVVPDDVDIVIGKQRLRTTTPPEPGSQVDYLVTVTNLGSGDATNVIVNDLLPAGFVNLITSITSTTGSTTATYNTLTGVLAIPSLPAQEAVTLSITATLDRLACGNIINTASLGSVDQTDIDSSNDQATDEFQLTPCISCIDLANTRRVATADGEADLPICHTCPNPLRPGQTVPPITTTITGGNPDGFSLTDGVESTISSAGLQAIINNYATVNGNFIPGRANRPFDVMSDNQFFGHTLTGLPANIFDASLEISLKAGGANNDEIGFLDNAGAITWIRPIRNLTEAGGSWTQQNAVFKLNLHQLPNNTNPATDLLPNLNTDQTLDVFVQDDTAVDYMTLTVQHCPAVVTQFPGELSTLRAGTGHLSGSWFDTSKDGQGLSLEVLEGDSAVLTWYNYDGLGNPRWMIGVGSVAGTTVTVDEMTITSGGIFGPGFDPSSVNREPWGRVSIDFSSCDSGLLQYQSTARTEVGTQQLTRLTNLSGLKCELPNTSAQTLPDDEDKYSGTWFDPDHDGEGLVVQMLENDQALVYWYTYDQSGNQVWILGVGPVNGDTITVDELITASGGIFGPNFDPDTVVREQWGTINITFTSCTESTLQYQSILSGFGSGQQNLTRLTSVKGLGCQ